MRQKIKLSQLEPNPFRNINRYPLNRDKIEELKESISQTGFWDNLVVRVNPDNPNKYQIAYGHHRLHALKEMYNGDGEVNPIVRDLDNDHMFIMMARENAEEYGAAPIVYQETVRAAVEALARGQLPGLAEICAEDTHTQNGHEVEAKTKNSEFRFAPNFVRNSMREKLDKDDRPTVTIIAHLGPAYVASSLGRYMGWTRKDATHKIGNRASKKLELALAALEFIELGYLPENAFDNVRTTLEVEAIIMATREQVRIQELHSKEAQVQINNLKEKEEKTKGYDAKNRIQAQIEERKNKLKEIAENTKSASNNIIKEYQKTKAEGQEGPAVVKEIAKRHVNNPRKSKPKKKQTSFIHEEVTYVSTMVHDLVDFDSDLTKRVKGLALRKDEIPNEMRTNLIRQLAVAIRQFKWFTDLLQPDSKNLQVQDASIEDAEFEEVGTIN